MKRDFSHAHRNIIDELIQYHAAKLHALSERRARLDSIGGGHLVSAGVTDSSASPDSTLLAKELIAMWKGQAEIRQHFRTLAEFADYIDQMLAGTQPWNPAFLPPGDALAHANTKRSRS